MQEGQNLVRFELDPADKRSLYKAFKDMDDNSKNELKREVQSISQWMADEIVSAAQTAPRPEQAKAIARSVKARKDRMPYIVIGGARYKTQHGTPVGVIMHGNEFGSNRFRQFPWWSGKSPTGRGSNGYWIYPTLRSKQARLTHEWKQAIERWVINPWGRNG